MSGYIYVIRRALQEYQNEPIYKVGKTVKLNPFEHLKPTYDPGFRVYSIISVDDINDAESKLLYALNTHADKFELVESNTFKLSGKYTRVSEITSHLLNILDEHADINIVEDEKLESDNTYLTELEAITPENVKKPIRDVIEKYYDVIPSPSVKFLYSEFIQHKELAGLKSIHNGEEIIVDGNSIIDAIIYKMTNYKLNPTHVKWGKSNEYIGCLSLKKAYTQELKVDTNYTPENVMSNFTNRYPPRLLYEGVNVRRCFKLAEFIEQKMACVKTTLPNFKYFARVFRFHVSKYLSEYSWFADNNNASVEELTLAFFILGVNISAEMESNNVWINGLVIDANHPNFIESFN